MSGEFKGRTLVAPKGRSTRPTADRVREGLFSALESRLGAGLGGASVLDAFAGSGALGLEALSRGAERATFVEMDAAAVRSLRANVNSLAVSDRTSVVFGDVRIAIKRGPLPGSPFSLLFLDPPYRIGHSEVRALIEALASAGGLTREALVIWEHDSAEPASWPTSVEPWFGLRYGSTTVDAGTFADGVSK